MLSLLCARSGPLHHFSTRRQAPQLIAFTLIQRVQGLAAEGLPVHLVLLHLVWRDIRQHVADQRQNQVRLLAEPAREGPRF